MKNLKKEFLITFISGAVLLTGIVVLLNMISGNFNIGRFDLTADRIYELSPSVKKVLSSLEAPIELTYYVSSSEKMPTRWKNLERDVIDKLEDLRQVSGGMMTYKVFDPSAEEEKEALRQSKEEADTNNLMGEETSHTTKKVIAQRLAEKGVIPFGVQSTSQDEFAIKRVYSSIVLSYLDRKEEVIEEVRPESFGSLEYDIISRIYKLINTRRPRIGFYPGQPEIPPQYRQYYQQGPPPDMYSDAESLLKDAGYDVTRTNITKDDPVPENIKTMIVMADGMLNQRQLFEISKLAHQGVHLILAGQQYNFQISPSSQPGEYMLQGMPTGSNLSGLTKQWGFEFDKDIFMDRSSAYIQIPVYQMRNLGAFRVRQQRMEPVTKPVIIKINAENINNKLSISNKISELFYLYGGKLDLDRDLLNKSDRKVQTLFTSSNYCWTTKASGYGPVNDRPPTPDQILRKQPLGILVQGTFASAWADSTMPSWPAGPGEQSDTTEASSGITGEAQSNKMLVYGCTNLFKNDVLKAVPSHQALLLNSVDALTLGDELINIRSKNIQTRRVREVSSFSKALSKAFVVWFAPLVMVGLGLYINVQRKKRISKR